MPSRVADVVGVQTFRDTQNYYLGVDANDAPVGSASMTVILVMVVQRLIDASVQRAVAHCDVVASGGWRTRILQTGGNIGWQFNAVDGGGVERNATPIYNPRSSEVIFQTSSLLDGNVRCRLNGVLDTVACVGFTVPSQPIVFGNRPAVFDQSANNIALAAFLGSSTVGFTAAQLATAEAQLREDLANGRDLRAALPAADLVYYDARDVVLPGGACRETWAPRVGAGVTLTRVGAPEGACYRAQVVP